jgi:hypothetical protein
MTNATMSLLPPPFAFGTQAQLHPPSLPPPRAARSPLRSTARSPPCSPTPELQHPDSPRAGQGAGTTSDSPLGLPFQTDCDTPTLSRAVVSLCVFLLVSTLVTQLHDLTQSESDI